MIPAARLTQQNNSCIAQQKQLLPQRLLNSSCLNDSRNNFCLNGSRTASASMVAEQLLPRAVETAPASHSRTAPASTAAETASASTAAEQLLPHAAEKQLLSQRLLNNSRLNGSRKTASVSTAVEQLRLHASEKTAPASTAVEQLLPHAAEQLPPCVAETASASRSRTTPALRSRNSFCLNGSRNSSRLAQQKQFRPHCRGVSGIAVRRR